MATTVERASVEDAPAILALQRLAYRPEADLYDDPTIPPLTQTLEELRLEVQDHLVLKATLEERLVGSVRARLDRDAWRIGRLVVHPTYQGRGVGRLLMETVEAARPAGSRCELFTGHQSERNLRLYRKLGYREVRREPVSANLTLVFLEKAITRP